MATLSSHNPFRANPLSPNATGASINPPPSFHTVAGDDETTINPMADNVPDLPVIPEDDYERDLPSVPTPEPPTANRERDLPSLPSPVREARGPSITLDPPPPRIREEEPPAYTARPDVHQGESTLEVGPRRAFQQPQLTGSPSPGPNLFPSYTGPGTANHSPAYLSPNPTGSSFPGRNRGGRRPGLIQQFLADIVPQFEQLTGIGNLTTPQPGQYAGSPPRHARSFSSFTSNPGVSTSTSPPPPLPPRQNSVSTSRLSPNPTRSSPNLTPARSPSAGSNSTSVTARTTTTARSTSSGTTNATSDFARDFYAAGEGEGLLNLESDSSSDLHRVPEEPVRNTRSIPSRPPVRRRSSFDVTQVATTSPPPPSPSQPSSPTRAPANDDNRPTARPTPGHPLLRDGKILVYPKGVTCSKCFNVGYKRADPRHPCKKCWNKYSKAYTPALLYAPDTNAVTTLQRPLPRFVPPQGSPPPPAAGPAPSGSRSGGQFPLFVAEPTCRRPNRLRTHQYSFSESSPAVNRSFGSPGPGNVMAAGMGGPPPGALVYPAGDPRLGGRMCWRCGGSGSISYFILDTSKCDECGGIGRLFGY